MRRRPRIPVQRYPHGLEREYARALVKYVRDLRAHAIPKLIAAINASTVRTDQKEPVAAPHAKLGSTQELVRTLNGVLLSWDAITTEARPGLLAQEVGKRVIAFASKSVKRQMAALVTIPTTDHTPPQDLAGFVDGNTALIKSLPVQLHAQLGDVVTEAFNNGTRSGDIADLLEERFGVAESRAALIARDQVGKLNGKVTQSRQQSLGVTTFIWRTSLDERVRPTHAALEGEPFPWATGVPELDGDHNVIPGQPVQCRCRAEPVLDHLLGGDQ